ncbi:MAG TPA: copper homeostasis protein CutC [Rudaea sp.]|jgi:copper homeostasis protein
MAPARPTLLEIAANSLASALAAQEGGADRIELCTALELGGLTPTHAQISLVRERVRLPIHVLIRPRGGDFVYSDLEFETMQRDIESCAALGCDGVVIGALDAAGNIDARCSALIGAAGKLDITFHRAIDVSRDPRRALEEIIALRCRRVLTSGARACALDGVAMIRELIAQSNGRVAVMPGAGVDATNVAAIRLSTGAREFHASAKRRLPSRGAPAPGSAAGMEEGELRTDIEQVRALVAALRGTAD